MSYFPNDVYDTPEDTPRLQLDRLIHPSRLYFFAGFLSQVFRHWRTVKRGAYDGAAWAESSFELLQFIEGCGGRFHITGIDNLRRQPGPFVLVSNHMSSLETAVMPGIIVPILPMTSIAKSSLLKYPFFGPVVAATQPILVDRVSPRADFQMVMQQGQSVLAEGTSVVVYPQSTRTAVFDPQAFNSLGVKLARRADVPIIPVAVKTDFWAAGKYLKDFGPIHRDRPIHINFGKPFAVGPNSKDAHQRVISFIQSHLDSWQKEQKYVESDR